MDSTSKPKLKMEFENGVLVKIDGMRPEYKNGNELLTLVRQLAWALNEINDTVYGNPTLCDSDYFKVRSLATNACLMRER